MLGRKESVKEPDSTGGSTVLDREPVDWGYLIPSAGVRYYVFVEKQHELAEEKQPTRLEVTSANKGFRNSAPAGSNFPDEEQA